jgi:hypothetical protein
MPRETTAEDRARGCLLGLAVGDALGVTQELLPRLTTDIDEMHLAVLKQRKLRLLRGAQTKMEGYGPFMPNIRLKPGEFTDDTSMALCLADSLIAKQTLDPMDLMQRFVRWEAEGYNSSIGKAFGVGGNVSAALARFQQDPSNPIAGTLLQKISRCRGIDSALVPFFIFIFYFLLVDLPGSRKTSRCRGIDSLFHHPRISLSAALCSLSAALLIRFFNALILCLLAVVSLLCIVVFL